MRARTIMRTACLSGAVLLALATALVPSASGQSDVEAGRPASFTGYAYSAPIHFSTTPDPPVFFPEFFRVDIPHGESTFAAGGVSEARASFLYPGPIGDGAGMLCTFGLPCQEHPEFGTFIRPWPFNANASYPTAIDARPLLSAQPVSDDQNFAITAAKADAHAGRDHVETKATFSGFAFGRLTADPSLGASNTVLHAQGGYARTHQGFDADGFLVSHAESVLTGVSLFGGVIKADEIRSATDSRSKPGQAGTAIPTFTATGVTVNGQPARFGPNGMETPAGDPFSFAPLPVQPNPLADGLSRLISSNFVSITTIETESDVSDQSVANVTGIRVDYKFDASGLPNGVGIGGHLVLGIARTAATTSDLASDGGGLITDDLTGGFDDGFDGSGFGPGAGAVLSDDFGASPGLGGSSGGDRSVRSDLGGGIAAGPSPAVGVSPRLSTPLETLAGNVSSRVTLMYLSFALAAIGLAVGSRRPFSQLARNR